MFLEYHLDLTFLHSYLSISTLIQAPHVKVILWIFWLSSSHEIPETSSRGIKEQEKLPLLTLPFKSKYGILTTKHLSLV